jgi:hypothetical protein
MGTKPISVELPFETHSAHDTGEVFVSREATGSAETLFGLSSEWPGF